VTPWENPSLRSVSALSYGFLPAATRDVGYATGYIRIPYVKALAETQPTRLCNIKTINLLSTARIMPSGRHLCEWLLILIPVDVPLVDHPPRTTKLMDSLTEGAASVG
jgi:hypothetical protein